MINGRDATHHPENSGKCFKENELQPQKQLSPLEWGLQNSSGYCGAKHGYKADIGATLRVTI